MFLRFTQKFKMPTNYENGAKNYFWEKSPVDSADTLGVKTFDEIVLSRTVSEINAFMCFTQKFKMAAKNGGKMIYGKCHQFTLLTP